MTIQTSHAAKTFPRAQAATPAATVVVAAAYRNKYPKRDFGVGYGSSSGYASSKRYASDWGNALFRCG